MTQIAGCTHALYWPRFSNRTFFVINADAGITSDLARLGERWQQGIELLVQQTAQTGCREHRLQ